MTKEHPQPFLVRLYKAQRRAVKRKARELHISEAELIRRLIINFL